uniref:Uncharacterized protein n=1 Tax=Anopheles melas TaxID=34690 RepID=A0A182TK21_9DIPT
MVVVVVVLLLHMLRFFILIFHPLHICEVLRETHIAGGLKRAKGSIDTDTSIANMKEMKEEHTTGYREREERFRPSSKPEIDIGPAQKKERWKESTRENARNA